MIFRLKKINYKKDKFAEMKINQEKDYLPKDKTASFLYTKMNPEQGGNKRQKMKSKGFF